MINDIALHNADFSDFIKTLDHCKGDVFLETADGDVLNLKSKLCQIIGIANILKSAEISEAKIRCSNPEDETLLFRFNLYGKIEHFINEHRISVVESDFGADVSIVVRLRTEDVSAFEHDITELTSARAKTEIIDRGWNEM